MNIRTLGVAQGIFLLAALGLAAPRTITHRTFRYTCDGGQQIGVAYVNYGSKGVSFAVLEWNGQQYGLAPASGARYASLYGPTPGGKGLEWWEAKGSATLSTFTGKDFSETRPLLTNCRLRR